MKATLRPAAVALTGLLLASGGSLMGASAAASRPTAGACTSSTGVTVVVDFGSAGGGVKTGCAAAPVKTGFEALVKAGFDITNVRSQPGFLCQIDAKPTSDCQSVPSATGYWSYWTASRGGSWTYSGTGASRTPPAGSVEGWSFGASLPPGSSPPGPIVTTTTSRSTPSSTDPQPATATTATTSGASTTLAPSGVTDTTTSVRGALDASTSTSGPSFSDDADDLDAGVEKATANPSGDDTSSPVGVVLAGVLLAGLGTLGVGTARRRARDTEGAA